MEKVLVLEKTIDRGHKDKDLKSISQSHQSTKVYYEGNTLTL